MEYEPHSDDLDHFCPMIAPASWEKPEPAVSFVQLASNSSSSLSGKPAKIESTLGNARMRVFGTIPASCSLKNFPTRRSSPRKRLFSNSRDKDSRRWRLEGSNSIFAKSWPGTAWILADFVILAFAADANWLSIFSSDTPLIRARLCNTRALPRSSTRSLRCKSNRSFAML